MSLAFASGFFVCARYAASLPSPPVPRLPLPIPSREACPEPSRSGGVGFVVSFHRAAFT